MYVWLSAVGSGFWSRDVGFFQELLELANLVALTTELRNFINSSKTIHIWPREISRDMQLCIPPYA